MKELITAVCEKAGFEYLQHKNVQGGDINKAFRVQTHQGDYFLKVNYASAFPGMFEKEAAGLIVLKERSQVKVPAVIATGSHEKWQWLLLEWLEKENISHSFWPTFGSSIALLHLNTQATFGWETENFIGSLIQQNDQVHTWAEFYASQRIYPLVKLLFDAGIFYNNEVKDAENICARLNEFFPGEPPALLHGDLWSGNFMVTINEMPAIFDPAVYYGHREMDLGMTKLFGGFDNRFYDDYNEVYPLERNWLKRLSLTQLYPLLVHAQLFGGSYIIQCKHILKEWR